jgi:hypothetical protein
MSIPDNDLLSNTLLESALSYYDAGFSVIPIVPGDKRPAVRWEQYQKQRANIDQLKAWFSNGHYNALGIITGKVSNGLVILDFDGEGWQHARDDLLSQFPELKDTLHVKTGSGKLHIWLSADDMSNGKGNITRLQFTRPDLGEKTAIELRCNTVQTLAPPSLHPSGGHYEFSNDADIKRVKSLSGLIQWLETWGRNEGPNIPDSERKCKGEHYIAVLEYLGYRFSLNICNDVVLVNDEPMTDVKEAVIKSDLRDYGLRFVNIARDYYIAEAAKHPFHPVRNYLEGLTWNGNDYITDLAVYIDDADNVFLPFFRRWAIGAVARAYEETQNRTLVLEGAQGIGKSYIAKWLCSDIPNLFAEGSINPDQKDHKLRLTTTWIWEIGELGAVTRRADREALKQMLSMRVVKERRAYGRYDIHKPAMTSFLGTINNECGFLNDPTGHRRFMVVALKRINWDYSKDIKPSNIWAQAYALYRAGEPWELTREEQVLAGQINNTFEIEDPLEDLLHTHLTPDPNNFIESVEIVNKLRLLGWRGGNSTRAETMAVSSVLKKMGFEKIRPSGGARGYAACWR